MKRKQIALIAAALVISIGLGFVFSVHVSAASTPSLFHNDERWYRDTSAGLEIIGGLYYVPVDVFGMFRHLELTMDSRRGEFMVYNRNTGAYISVLYSEKIASINGEDEAYLNLYKLHGDIITCRRSISVPSCPWDTRCAAAADRRWMHPFASSMAVRPKPSMNCWRDMPLIHRAIHRIHFRLLRIREHPAPISLPAPIILRSTPSPPLPWRVFCKLWKHTG